MLTATECVVAVARLKEEAARAMNGLQVGKTAAIDTPQMKPPNWMEAIAIADLVLSSFRLH